jgi:hypothetical protein
LAVSILENRGWLNHRRKSCGLYHL